MEHRDSRLENMRVHERESRSVESVEHRDSRLENMRVHAHESRSVDAQEERTVENEEQRSFRLEDDMQRTHACITRASRTEISLTV